LGKNLKEMAGDGVEFLGRVSDNQMYRYYGECKAFLALAENEDFGMTLVEVMAAGRPVIAFEGGGYLETVVDGKTGFFFGDLTVFGLAKVLSSFDKLKTQVFAGEDCRKQARKFSKERFVEEIKKEVCRVKKT